jgi:peptidoglycan/xylan/chitin deacetylase (PgdA/CDA1 family)
MAGNALLAGLWRSGALMAAHRLWRRRLTVLSYHRVTDSSHPNVFAPVISATVEGFAEQLAFIGAHFHVIDLDSLAAWLHGDGDLPDYPLLITFDDGYRDNHDSAWPLLQRHGFPALMFLTSRHIGADVPFYWDQVAFALAHASASEARLPLLGRRRWSGSPERDVVVRELVGRLKYEPETRKQELLADLQRILNVKAPPGFFQSLHLDWEQVRRMARAGMAFGAHTRSHPILTRLSRSDAEAEIAGAKQDIERELGTPVTAFAYPHGRTGDFNAALEALLRRLGFVAGFTLMDGPAGLGAVRRAPLCIRRVYIDRRDDLPRFAAKLVGAARLKFRS